MKSVYHFCFSSDEVMFRSDEDYVRAFNCYALALLKTESLSLADAIMSNHFHAIVQTGDLASLVSSMRNSYTKYFNNKYCRRGRLGEKSYFSLEVKGTRHLLAAISYVLRNPLHHGVSATPFGYKYSSINTIFKKELGRCSDKFPLSSASGNISGQGKRIRKNLSKNRKERRLGLMFDGSGMLLREQFTESAQVELIYVSPRNFLYYMNRLSDLAWLKEQERDNNGVCPIDLSDIEYGTSLSPYEKMLVNERGRADYDKVSDSDLCSFIDTLCLKHYNGKSVYQLLQREREFVERAVFHEYHGLVPTEQLRRCLPR